MRTAGVPIMAKIGVIPSINDCVANVEDPDIVQV
jgi:hypothetical protein